MAKSAADYDILKLVGVLYTGEPFSFKIGNHAHSKYLSLEAMRVIERANICVLLGKTFNDTEWNYISEKNRYFDDYFCGRGSLKDLNNDISNGNMRIVHSDVEIQMAAEARASEIVEGYF